MTIQLAPALQPDRPETPWPDPPDLPRPIAAYMSAIGGVR